MNFATIKLGRISGSIKSFVFAAAVALAAVTVGAGNLMASHQNKGSGHHDHSSDHDKKHHDKCDDKKDKCHEPKGSGSCTPPPTCDGKGSGSTTPMTGGGKGSGSSTPTTEGGKGSGSGTPTTTGGKGSGSSTPTTTPEDKKKLIIAASGRVKDDEYRVAKDSAALTQAQLKMDIDRKAGTLTADDVAAYNKVMAQLAKDEAQYQKDAAELSKLLGSK